MKDNKTKKHIVRWILLALLVVVLVIACFFSYFGGFGTGKCADTEEFAKYAGTISDISVPEQARVIGLGEATHGNIEFQQLKLEVFKIMVEKYGVRAFALEGDYGGCEVVNQYIHGGSGTAQEAAAAIGFPIYQTEQMEQLISWMREYNTMASEDDKLCFYGFDMQRYEKNCHFLLEVAKELGVSVSELEQIWDEEKGCFSETYNSEQWTKVIEDVKHELQQCDAPQAVQAVHFADILLQNHEIGKVMDSMANGIVLRDRYMADNVHWILDQEAARGNHRIFVSAHNGHIGKRHEYGTSGKAMGNLLANELGEGYFAIGTDFFKARVSLPKGDSHTNRSNHTFYSYNPLAKASKKCGYGMSWLDFSRIPIDSPLKQNVTGYIWMGSVGEGYSPLMAIMPMAYRVWDSPTELYDGMIFVSKAHPIEVRKSYEE